jgi:CDP-glucose 4,6-dehydratase
VSAAPLPGFWCGRRVLVTGHSGFKGGWLTLWLRQLGAEVVGLSLPPNTTPSLFEAARIAGACESHIGDIRDEATVRRVVRDAAPEIVFHLAAQPLVRASFRAPLETFAANVMGAAHVLDALRDLPSLRAAVMITTDKVYKNLETLRPYGEDDALGGHDPYSASKAASEIVIESYRKSFLAEAGVAVASARAGNVIGGGDWSEDRLIPDAIRTWSAGETLPVRRPEAVRPWQHVLEPLGGYLRLAETLVVRPGVVTAVNFGPPPAEAAPVRDVVEMARGAWRCGEAKVAYATASEGPHEAGLLVLDNSRARDVLGVAPRLSLAAAVRQTVQWYEAFAAGQDAQALCLSEIEAFVAGQAS